MRRLAAVVRKDLLLMGRGATFFRLRGGYALLVALLTMLVLLPALKDLGGSVYRGQAVTWSVVAAFAIWAVVQGAVVLLAMPVDIALGAERERRDRTLSLVCLSRIRPSEIVAGAFGVRLALTVAILLAALPVLALLSWLGGLATRSAFEVVLLAFGIGFLGLAFGIAVGFLPVDPALRRPLLPGLCLLFFGVLWIPALRGWLHPWHPAVALWEAASQTPAALRTASLPGVLAACLLLGLPALALAVWAVPRAALRAPTRSTARPRQRRIGRKEAPTRGNAVAWMAPRIRAVPSGVMALLAGIVYAAIVYGGIVLALAPSFHTGLYGVLYLVPAFWLAGAVHAGAPAGAVRLLAATPLSTRTILRGLLAAGGRRFLLFALAPGATLLWVVARMLDGHFWGVFWTGAHLLAHCLFALILGLLFATVHTRASWAGGWAAAALLLLHLEVPVAMVMGAALADSASSGATTFALLLTLSLAGTLALIAVGWRGIGGETARFWAYLLAYGWGPPFLAGLAGHWFLNRWLDTGDGTAVLATIMTPVLLYLLAGSVLAFELARRAFDRLTGRAP